MSAPSPLFTFLSESTTTIVAPSPVFTFLRGFDARPTLGELFYFQGIAITPLDYDGIKAKQVKSGTFDGTAVGRSPFGLGLFNSETVLRAFISGSIPPSVLGMSIEEQEVVAAETITDTDTALTDTLDHTPISSTSVKLYLDGVLKVQGAGQDYTISGTTITWLASSGTAPNITASNVIQVVYSYATG